MGGHLTPALAGGGDVVAFHPTEKMLLAVNLAPVLFKDAEKQGFLLLDIQVAARQATIRQFFPETIPVTALAFHSDGNRIAALLKNSAIHLWTIDIGQKICIEK